MRFFSRKSSFVRRATVVTAAAALGMATFGATQASAAQSDVNPAAKHAAINTKKVWDGSSNIQAFGCPDTTTYGEVITIPDGKTTLNKFSFWMTDFGAQGSMVVRGEVYAWDGTKATGSDLFESDPKTLSFGDMAFHRVAFPTGGVAVTPGSQYVIFASIDKDYESCTGASGSYTTGWGSVDDSVYPGGSFVFQNNGGDESQWTTSGWTSFGYDLAFKAFITK